MKVNRARALIITPNNKILLIKRLEPGKDIYHIFPGGHLEPEDNNNLENTITRELKEEIAAKGIEINKPIFYDPIENQIIYLVKIQSWSQEDRTGLEYLDPTRGEDIIEEVDTDKFGDLDTLDNVRDHILQYINDIESIPSLNINKYS